MWIVVRAGGRSHNESIGWLKSGESAQSAQIAKLSDLIENCGYARNGAAEQIQELDTFAGMAGRLVRSTVCAQTPRLPQRRKSPRFLLLGNLPAWRAKPPCFRGSTPRRAKCSTARAVRRRSCSSVRLDRRTCNPHWRIHAGQPVRQRVACAADEFRRSWCRAGRQSVGSLRRKPRRRPARRYSSFHNQCR